jgi:hypothetical protein
MRDRPRVDDGGRTGGRPKKASVGEPGGLNHHTFVHKNMERLPQSRTDMALPKSPKRIERMDRMKKESQSSGEELCEVGIPV